MIRLAESVRVMYAISIFFSYSLQASSSGCSFQYFKSSNIPKHIRFFSQFYIPMQILGPWFTNQFFDECNQKWSDGILRVSLTTLTSKPIETSYLFCMIIQLLICKYLSLIFFSCVSRLCAETWGNNFSARSCVFVMSCVDLSANS